jgi:carbamoyl-phosphate synthase large subunit
MVKPNILVSAVSGDIGSAVVRSLKEAGYTIVGCDIKPYSPVSEFMIKNYQVPPALETESYLNCLRNIFRTERINIFLPVSESEIDVLNCCREAEELKGVKLLINNQAIVDNFLDKLKTMRYLENIGIKVPKTAPLRLYDGSFGFPVIVKAAKGSGSKRLWKAEDKWDMDYIRRKDDGALIAQEYIGSEDGDFTTGIFSDGKKVSAITFKRTLGYGGLSVEVVLKEEPFLEALAQRIALKTALIGSINLQSRRIGEIFMPYEINPRLSSTLLFRKKFGFDDAVWWVQTLEDKGYEHTYERRYRSGKALRGLSEHYFDLEEA